MNRALFVLAVVVPSLAFACGGGQGLGGGAGLLLLLFVFGGPVLGLLLAVFFIARAWNAKTPAR